MKIFKKFNFKLVLHTKNMNKKIYSKSKLP